MNPLNVRSKKQTVYAASILSSPSFIKGRKATPAGRKLYNKEIKYVKAKAKQFGVMVKKTWDRL